VPPSRITAWTPGDLKRFTVDVTSGLAFGTDLNTLETEGDAIQKHLGVVFPVLAKRVLAPFAYWRWIRFHPIARSIARCGSPGARQWPRPRRPGAPDQGVSIWRASGKFSRGHGPRTEWRHRIHR
jgi:hypothetical protein